MGFAPLGSMPVTRRAPYFAIAIWSGGQGSQKYRSPPGHVGFIDCTMPELSNRPEHSFDSLWSSTVLAVKALLEAPPLDDRKVLHDVAFCLPCDAASVLVAR